MKPARLGIFERLILIAVKSLGGNAYGWSVIHRLRASGFSPSPGNVYTALLRLQGKQLITLADDPITSSRRGRRMITLTETGYDAVADTELRLSGLKEGF